MEKGKVTEFLKKYTMIIVLIIVVLFFTWQTDGRMLLPQNVNNLISQNAYVFILATGMLLCILTGGNIDLSVGSVVCFVGAVGATVMVNMKMNIFVGILVMLAVGPGHRRMAGLLDRLPADPALRRDAGRHADVPRPLQHRAGRLHHRTHAPGILKPVQQLHH